MTQEQDTAMLDQPEPLIGPDCVAGKCTACDGRAWDPTADDVTECCCECHEAAEPVPDTPTP
jgi:hypothetical protein